MIISQEKSIIRTAVAILVLGVMPASGTQTGTPPLDFEGYGAVTRGAESSPSGHEIFRVTSLADSGSGTLRDALSTGHRYIVFDVAGTITLASDLNIPWSYITIDGATAPSPGITIVQPGNIGTTIEALASTGPTHDIIIHHLRMDGQATSNTNVGDIWGLDGESAPVYNVIIDHVTGIAATDGVFDIYEDVHDVTLSWNLILDTLAALHLSTGDISVPRQRISLHHNLFARNNERQVRLRHHNDEIDFVNNVVYGWGWMEGGAQGLDIQHDAGETNTSINVERNVFHYVSGLHGSPEEAIRFVRGPDEGQVFFSDNLVPATETNAVSNAARLPILAYVEVTHHAANTLGDAVVPCVGTHYPTAEEQTLLTTVSQAIGGSGGVCAAAPPPPPPLPPGGAGAAWTVPEPGRLTFMRRWPTAGVEERTARVPHTVVPLASGTRLAQSPSASQAGRGALLSCERGPRRTCDRD